MSFLKQIDLIKREEVAATSLQLPFADLKQQVLDCGQEGDEKFRFYPALANSSGMAVIAEVKGASPSKGVIKDQFDPVSVAQGYASSGAQALSILTDERYFHGSLAYLNNVSQAVSLPCLRKDFIIDPYQIYQAKLYGASAYLLIVKMLSRNQFEHLYGLGQELGLDVLVEVHDEADLEVIEDLPVNLLGVNNRNLDSLDVDLNTSIALKPLIKQYIKGDPLCVAESGLSCAQDVRRVYQAGYRAILIGSALMAAEDPAQALKQLLLDCGGVDVD